MSWCLCGLGRFNLDLTIPPSRLCTTYDSQVLYHLMSFDMRPGSLNARRAGMHGTCHKGRCLTRWAAMRCSPVLKLRSPSRACFHWSLLQDLCSLRFPPSGLQRKHICGLVVADFLITGLMLAWHLLLDFVSWGRETLQGPLLETCASSA